MGRKVLVLGGGDEGAVLARALQESADKRGANIEVSFAAIGTPTPKLDCIGQAVQAELSVPLRFGKPLLGGGATIKPPHDDSMPDG